MGLFYTFTELTLLLAETNLVLLLAFLTAGVSIIIAISASCVYINKQKAQQEKRKHSIPVNA